MSISEEAQLDYLQQRKSELKQQIINAQVRIDEINMLIDTIRKGRYIMKLDINSKDIEEVLDSFDDDNVDFAEFVRSLVGYKLSEQYDEPIKLISVTFNEDNTIECSLSKISLDERLDNER